jgi:hypothetical protein
VRLLVAKRETAMCVGRQVRRSRASPASSLDQRTTNPPHADLTSAMWTRSFRQVWSYFAFTSNTSLKCILAAEIVLVN